MFTIDNNRVRGSFDTMPTITCPNSSSVKAVNILTARGRTWEVKFCVDVSEAIGLFPARGVK